MRQFLSDVRSSVDADRGPLIDIWLVEFCSLGEFGKLVVVL